MSEKKNGKIILKTPIICDCRIKIDGMNKKINPFKRTQIIELPVGKHFINVGISYDEMPEDSPVYSATTWAWEYDKQIEINERDLCIQIKRKWHLLKPVTVEALVKEEGTKDNGSR